MRPRIVAIDDETGFIEILKDYFTPRGYEIDTATRAVNGIEIIKAKKPDVVLMDLKMPGLDGDEALKLLKSMDPSPKVILITAYDDGGKTKARLIKAGAFTCLDKPISSLRDLEETINRAFNA
jgi:CheY-like chemotaxis protein